MIEQCDLSERRACRLAGLSRDSYGTMLAGKPASFKMGWPDAYTGNDSFRFKNSSALPAQSKKEKTKNLSTP